MKHRFWTLFLVFVISLLFTLPLQAQVCQVPENISVGLEYGEDALSEVVIKFQTGVRLSFQGEEVFTQNNIHEVKAIPVHDGYAEIATGFGNFECASDFAKTYILESGYQGLDCSPAYVGKQWSVWLDKESCYSLGVQYNNVVREHAMLFYGNAGQDLFFYQPFSGSSTEELRDTMATFSDLNGDTMKFGPSLRSYPGEMRVQRYHENGLTVINRVPFEIYIAAVISREMSPSWPLEALKAQAVASRSFILATEYNKIPLYMQYGFDINTTQQTYIGIDLAMDPKIQQAVSETKGEVARYMNALGSQETIAAYYSADCGGYTENCENVFYEALPYIRGVQELYPSGSPDFVWQPLEYMQEDIRKILQPSYGDIGTLQQIRITKTGAFGSLVEIEVKGSLKTLKLSNHQVIALFNLKSYNFTIQEKMNVSILNAPFSLSAYLGGLVKVMTSSGKQTQTLNSGTRVMTATGIQLLQGDTTSYLLTGGGYGHNLGMSQWGAKAMADHGHSYQEIIKFYYKGVTIGQ